MSPPTYEHFLADIYNAPNEDSWVDVLHCPTSGTDLSEAIIAERDLLDDRLTAVYTVLHT